MPQIPKLHYKSIGPSSKITNIFLHGYLGSHKNFINISKFISNELNQRSLVLDLRNHGLTFPHVDNMTYHALANDLYRFIDLHKLEKINLIGYSMGAKIIFEYILNEHHHPLNNSIINKIICLDNSPMRLDNLGQEFNNYIKILTELNDFINSNFNNGDIPKNWKKLSIKFLSNFKLSNDLSYYFLDLFEITHNGKIQFKINDYLLTEECLYELNDFEDYSNKQNVGINSLFIKGLKSDFITDKSWKMIKKVFTNPKLESFDCDHKSLLIYDVDKLKKLILNHLKEDA